MVRALIYSLLVVMFLLLSAGIGRYILRKEAERERIDKIIDELLEDLERGKK